MGGGKKKQSCLLIELSPTASFASSETRVEISACNFTDETFLVNPNSSRQTRYSLQKICRFRWQLSHYFAVMAEWMNFELLMPDFGGILGGGSSSDGVNNQVNYLYILKTSSNSSSFVTYPLSKSTSENRRNAPKSQSSSGQSGCKTNMKRKCSSCGSTDHIRTSQKCPKGNRRLDDQRVGGGDLPSGDSEDDLEQDSVDGGNEHEPIELSCESSEDSCSESDVA